MDEKTKKRGWVKNAVIIFLAIMLVLTFFSNTIMNRNLPQVATQYVSSGSIAARIRGQGTLTANAPYEVHFDEDRKIDQVKVRVGDKVEIGDVLITLVDPSQDEDSALQQAQKKLEEMKYDYRKFLLNMSSADYAKENRDISRQREEIKELEAELADNEKNAVSDAEMTAVKIGFSSAETRLEKAKEAVEEAQKALDAFLAANPGAGDSGDFEELTKAFVAADTTFKAKCLQYAQDYNRFLKAAEQLQENDERRYQLSSYMIALYEAFDGAPTPEVLGIVRIDQLLNDPRIDKTDPSMTVSFDTPSSYNREKIREAIKDMRMRDEDPENPIFQFETATDDEGKEYVVFGKYLTAFSEIQNAANDLIKAEDALYAAMNAAGTNSAVAAQKAALEKTLKEATDLQNSVQKEYDAASKLKEELDKRKADYDANKKDIEDKLKAAHKALEDLIFDLSQTQKSDNKKAQEEQLELEKMKKDLEDQEALVEKLSSGDSSVLVSQITAKAAGVIADIPANIKAGASFLANELLMTIDQTDRGYTLSFSVTNEQAQKVHIGDQAEVTTSNWWFDGVVEATLTSISNNPSDPRNSRMLVFTVTGDVKSGDQLTLALGERSRTYELVVPKSAIRSDSNGKFVLMLEQRASALGNRYYATRIDVEELASDDTLVAISGAISAWDYVITSASMPVEPGQQVRLTEN